MSQLTRAQLLQLILDELPSNGAEQITADDLRDVCNALVESTANRTDDVIVSAVVAGTNITIDNTDPENPIVTASGGGGGGVSTITSSELNVTSPSGPTVNIDASALVSATASAQGDATQALTNAASAQAAADSKVASLVAGTPNVTINNTDPQNPSVSVSQTTAGLLANIYFTADSETTTEGTFYKTDITGKGSTASSGNNNQVTLSTNNEASLPIEFLGPIATDPTTIPIGVYVGFLIFTVNSNSGDQRLKIESYVCDGQGVPVNAGGVVGSLGFETLNIADSGIVDATANRETSVRMDTTQGFTYNLAVGQRVRYVVRAEKVGGSGTKDLTLFSGSNYNSFFQVPILAPTVAYDQISNNGTELIKRTEMDFTGAGVTITDDPVNQKTTINIPGGGGGGVSTITSSELNVTSPSGPTVNIDASALVSATTSAQGDATQALTDAASAQGDATQALTDAASAQGDATQALTDAASAQAAADSKVASLVAGTNVTIDNTDPQNPVVNASGGGGGGVQSVVAGSGVSVDNSNPANPIVSSTLNGALQTWPIATARSNQTMSGNFPGGRAYAIAAVASEDTTINSIEFFCAQNPGGGTYGVAIYNSSYVRLAFESNKTASLGINVSQLTNDTGTPVSVTLNAGSAYYLVLESNINSMSNVARQTYNPPVSATVPPISFFIPNSRSIDPTGLPANISAYFGQVGSGALNYWLLAYTT